MPAMRDECIETDFDPEDVLPVHLYAPSLEGAVRLAKSGSKAFWTDNVGISRARDESNGGLHEAQYVVSGLRALIREAVEAQVSEAVKALKKEMQGVATKPRQVDCEGAGSIEQPADGPAGTSRDASKASRGRGGKRSSS